VFTLDDCGGNSTITIDSLTNGFFNSCYFDGDTLTEQAFVQFSENIGGSMFSTDCSVGSNLTIVPQFVGTPASFLGTCNTGTLGFWVINQCNDSLAVSVPYDTRDTEAPVFTLLPQDTITVSCGETLPAMVWNGFDNCWFTDSVEINTVNGVTTRTVTLTDRCGNSTSETQVIIYSVNILGNAVIENATCNEANGSITVDATGGQGPYSYEWSTSDETSTVDNLFPGNYTVTINDTNGCSVVQGYTVENNGGEFTLELVAQNNGCDGLGAIMTIINNATDPTFAWNTNETTSFIEDVPAGTYVVTVTDAFGCSSIASIDMNPPSILSHEVLDTIHPTCNGERGRLHVKGIGGTIDGNNSYTYTWTDVTGTVLSNEDELEALAGTYTVTIEDNAGCTTSATFTLVEPEQFSISVGRVSHHICTADRGTGSIEILGTGGVAPYRFDFGDNIDQNELLPDTYAVVAYDANGCSQIIQNIEVECRTGCQAALKNANLGNTLLEVEVGPYTEAIEFVMISKMGQRLQIDVPIDISISNLYMIDISQFPRGEYFLTIMNQAGQVVLGNIEGQQKAWYINSAL